MKLVRTDDAKLPANYESAKLAILNCYQIDECKDWADKAEAIASYAKQAGDREMEITAMRIRGRATERCGLLLKEIAPANGKRTDLEPGRDIPTRFTRKDAAEAAGMSKDQAVQAIRVSNFAESNPDEFERQIESPNPPTITKLAEQGIRRIGCTLKEFKAATHGGGAIRRFASEIEKYDPQEIVNGYSDIEREELRGYIHRIDQYMDKLIAKL